MSNETKRYTDGYMIYGCESCGKGFRMYLEETLEKGDKPVPFSIKCPFCEGRSYDVGFHRFPIRRRLIRARDPAFIDDGEDCGTSVHMDRAKPQYVKAKPNDPESADDRREAGGGHGR